MPFTGVMITPPGSKVLEYNARFEDPEIQTMMMLIENEDFASILLTCTQGKLYEIDLKTSPGYACKTTCNRNSPH